MTLIIDVKEADLGIHESKSITLTDEQSAAAAILLGALDAHDAEPGDGEVEEVDHVSAKVFGIKLSDTLTATLQLQP